MTEKEKGKFNPFVGELRPDEEILWLHTIRLTMPQHQDKKQHHSRNLFMAIWGIFAIFTCFIMGAGIYASPYLQGNLIMALYVIFIVLVPVSLLVPWLWIAIKRRPLGAYAVTNQRLLHYDSRKTTMLELEDLDVYYESEGSLSFNILYPGWHNIPDAKAVLCLIEKAAENRVDDLREKAFDDEKRKGQVQSIRR